MTTASSVDTVGPAHRPRQFSPSRVPTIAVPLILLFSSGTVIAAPEDSAPSHESPELEGIFANIGTDLEAAINGTIPGNSSAQVVGPLIENSVIRKECEPSHPVGEGPRCHYVVDSKYDPEVEFPESRGRRGGGPSCSLTDCMEVPCVDDPWGCQEDLLGDCGKQLAFPVTGVIQGTGGSWFQLYWGLADDSSTDELEGMVFASWLIQPSTLTVGADTYAFGAEVADNHGNAGNNYYRENPGHCKFIASHIARPFHYFVEGTAAGWSGTHSCSVSVSWERSVGGKFTFTDSGAHWEKRWGEDHICSGGGTFDSELVFSVGDAA